MYTIQLGLNLIWQPIFFGLLRPVPATVDIIALLGTTSYLTYVWSGIDEVATYLMLPYLGWLTFATYLSVCIALIIETTPLTRLLGRLRVSEQLGLQKARDWSAKAKLSSSKSAIRIGDVKQKQLAEGAVTASCAYHKCIYSCSRPVQKGNTQKDDGWS